MKYATFIWDGTRPKKRFTSKEEAIAWIEEEMQGWIVPGDTLESYSTDKGLVFFVETEHGAITDAWATLRIIGEPQCKQQH